MERCIPCFMTCWVQLVTFSWRSAALGGIKCVWGKQVSLCAVRLHLVFTIGRWLLSIRFQRAKKISKKLFCTLYPIFPTFGCDFLVPKPPTTADDVAVVFRLQSSAGGVIHGPEQRVGRCGSTVDGDPVQQLNWWITSYNYGVGMGIRRLESDFVG